jgi:hypothetical protein
MWHVAERDNRLVRTAGPEPFERAVGYFGDRSEACGCQRKVVVLGTRVRGAGARMDGSRGTGSQRPSSSSNGMTAFTRAMLRVGVLGIVAHAEHIQRQQRFAARIRDSDVKEEAAHSARREVGNKKRQPAAGGA